jgi:general secretion pathway protein C
MNRVARLCTFVLVLALAASLTAWFLEFSSRRTPTEPVRAISTGNPAARTQAADTAPIAALFGARADDEAGDIRLVGVIAQGKSGQGIALLSVDSKPAIALHVGEDIRPGITLAEVRADRVVVNRSGVPQEIRLPGKPAPEGITRVQ